MQTFNDMMCASDPVPAYGGYGVTLYHCMLPNAVADKETTWRRRLSAATRRTRR